MNITRKAIMQDKSCLKILIALTLLPIEFAMKLFLLGVTFLISVFGSYSQGTNWSSFIDSIPTLSSPRAFDLNQDGIKDIVYGGGTDGVASNNGIIAINGANGNLLWKRPARNEVFASALFMDITNDGIRDVFISGRQAQLLAINGATGALIWDYFPYNVNPGDSGLYNFYNPQFIDDVSGDNKPDLLVANGGDHEAPAWDTIRPPGHLMIVNSETGQLIAKAVVPDSAETYCSAIIADIQNDGTKWVLYGTGGENLGGSFYACPLASLLLNSLAPSIVLASDAQKGFIAPASLYKTLANQYDIIIQSFGGKVTKIKGANFSSPWTYQLPGTESSAAPVIGNFVGSITPDVFLVLFKGIAPSYSDFYQVMLDGQDGSVVFKDSLGAMHYASANAVDLNNDGRDEAIVSVNYFENGYYKNRIQQIDFQNNTIQQINATKTGVNIGSTPLISDLDNDNQLDIVYLVKKDSINPVGWKGVYTIRHETNSIIPNSGIAWGSYLSTKHDGVYNYSPINCGVGSLIGGTAIIQPSCNGLADGSLTITNSIAGNGPITYAWSNGATTSQINNLASGTYNVQVTDNQGCYEFSSYTIADPYFISFGGVAAPTCPGDTNGMATLNSTGCQCMFSTCTFLWENGVTNQPNNNLIEGWNSVQITHPNGCVVVDSVFVPFSVPLYDSVQFNNVSCAGNADGSILIYSSIPPTSLVFAWSTGAIINPVANLSPGNYHLVLSDDRPCSDTLQFYITEPEALTLSVLTQNVACYGLINGQLELVAIGGNGGYEYSVNNVISATPIYSQLTAGQYDVSVFDSLGCNTIIQNIIISQPQPLAMSLSATPESGANNLDGTASVSMSGGTPPYNIIWDNQQNDSLIVYLSEGWYTVIVNDSNGCVITDSIYVGMLNLNNLLENEISAYPNPVKDQLTFSSESEKVYLFDSRGALVLEDKNKSIINVAHLTGGIYTLHLINNERASIMRLVKLNE
jgi:hypothetical protein